MNGFVERLRLAMFKKNLNQTQLARLLGVSTVAISSMLKGNVQKPRYLELAAALDVDPDWLKNGDESEPPAKLSNPVSNTVKQTMPTTITNTNTNNTYNNESASNELMSRQDRLERYLDRLERQIDRLEDRLGRLESRLVK